MTRRSQVTRRRSYGRRQHELRKRRGDSPGVDWAADNDVARPPSRLDDGQQSGSQEAGRP